jgi:hypothetical protein
MDKIIGGIVALGLGVITIAGIYQLGKKGNPIVPTVGTVTNTTLSSLFK